MTSYGRNKNPDDEKNIAGQVPTYNLKNFHRINKKVDLEQTIIELGKPVQKNQIKMFKKTKNQCRNVTGEQKPLARRQNLVQTKKGPE